jgi:ubiquitin-conjugating enzyme E2 J2
MSASKVALKRLQKEYKAHQADPPPFVWAKPNEAKCVVSSVGPELLREARKLIQAPTACSILEWHYIFRGPPDTPFAGGEYWGTITFPKVRQKCSLSALVGRADRS